MYLAWKKNRGRYLQTVAKGIHFSVYEKRNTCTMKYDYVTATEVGGILLVCDRIAFVCMWSNV